MSHDLSRALSHAFSLLEEGATDPASPFHTPCLASIGLDGRPRQRTVVLRAWDFVARCVELHTDVRSAKFAEFASSAAAALHVWDPETRIQLRVSGRVHPHTNDDVARAAWARLHAGSRATYRVTPGPGAVIDAPSATSQMDEAAAFDVFCAVRLVVDELEYLHLEQGRYARAQFLWEDGRLTSMWLAP